MGFIFVPAILCVNLFPLGFRNGKPAPKGCRREITQAFVFWWKRRDRLVRRTVEHGTEKTCEQQAYADKASWNYGIHRSIRRDGENHASGTNKQQGKNKCYPAPDEAAALDLFEGGLGFHGNLPAVIILA